MPVIIENVSPRDLADDKLHSYRLRINSEVIAIFPHRRDEGLAECLRRAADSAERIGADKEIQYTKST